MPLGGGGGVNSVGVKRRKKNRETVIASLSLVFAALVAPATATPDCWKGQQSQSERGRTLTT